MSTLSTLIAFIKGFFEKSSIKNASIKTIAVVGRCPPVVRLEFTDIDEMENKFLNRFSNPETDPSGRSVEGITFTFRTFNESELEVGRGKASLIPRKQVIVHFIETQKGYQGQGYGTAVLLALHQWARGLCIVPEKELASADEFWYKMRKRSPTAGIVREQITKLDAEKFIQEARKEKMVIKKIENME